MARLIVGLLELALVLRLVSSPLAAHHSFGAEFDSQKPVVLTGVVTKIEWTNPHSHIYLDVKDPRGRLEHWRLEGYTVNALYRTGWKKDVSMKVGDTVTVTGWKARDGSNAAQAREVTLTSGKKLFFGPPAGTGDGGSVPPVKAP